LLLILFNFVGIIDKTEKEQSKTLLKKSKLTGYIISNQSTQDLTNLKQEKNILKNQSQEQAELYSETSYFIYYLMILTLIIFMTLITITIILPRIKHLT